MKIDTKHKIWLAAIAYKIIAFIRSSFRRDDNIQLRRSGVNWELDLREGIDFSIYLLGGFELGTLRLYKKLLGQKSGEIVLDIGANIGAHVLPLACLVVPRGGKVYAFEPTDFAYAKLLRNIMLNPSVSEGIVPLQLMLVEEDGIPVDQEIYASWPLVDGRELHPNHHGKLKTTRGATSLSLDSFVDIHNIQRIDFIKLDVDGHEADVLKGATLSLQRFYPTLLMEWAPNLFVDDSMYLALAHLLEMGYKLYDGASGCQILGGYEELNRRTPQKGSMNILLSLQDEQTCCKYNL